MKIYTRTGDDGTTGLVGGSRVRKSDPRIECTGAMDELNAAIGLAAVAADGGLLEALRKAQSDLFVIGSHLATPGPRAQRSSLPELDERIVTELETRIDAADAQLPPLRNFILPGGSELAARLHMARTVCRRAERIVVEFAERLAAPPLVVRYLNRLSDWLFVEARLANQMAQVEDIPWLGR